MKKLFLCLLLLASLVATPSFAANRDITLAWDHDGVDLAGFKIYYGTSAGAYSAPVDVGMASKCADLAITPEEFCYILNVDVPDDSTTAFYITGTAYDAESNESVYATEITEVYDFEVPPTVVDLSASYDKGTSVLTFSWTYETNWLPKIEKWTLLESLTPGTGYLKVVDIPYDPNATPPYTTEVTLTVVEEQVTKYYVMVAHRGEENNNAYSENSNEVTVVIDKMPPKSPFEFKIKIR